MKTRHLLLPIVVCLVLLLILTLQWAVGGLSVPVWAAPVVDAPSAPSAELHVCSAGPPTCDYAHIQDAVDAAAPGTDIKIATGVYTDVHTRASLTQMVYISKTVNLKGGYAPPDWSHSNPQANPTTLDADGKGRVIYVTGPIHPSIENLNITGGDASGLGGGPYPYDDGSGGGIYVYTATATISNCMIYDNIAGRTDWSGGGGVYLYASPSRLFANTIYSNTAGISAPASLAGEGGGVAMAASNALLKDNVIRGNTAAMAGEGLGGGLYIEGSFSLHGTNAGPVIPVLKNNVIVNNAASRSAWGGGGGIWFGLPAYPYLVNTVLAGNSSGTAANSPGSAVAVEWSYPTFYHTTIHDNTGGNGSGVDAFSGSMVFMTNTILVSQTVGATAASGNSIVLDGVLWWGNGKNIDGTGTLSATSEYTGTPGFRADGYHLQPHSAAIEKAVATSVDWDIDSQSRPFGTASDLGADEWHGEFELDPETGGTFTFPGITGLPVIVSVPPGAVVDTTMLSFMPLAMPTYPLPSDMCYGGQAFNLDAYCLKAGHKVFLPFVSRDYSASPTTTVSSLSFPTVVPALSAPEPTACTSDLEPCPISFQKPVSITIHYNSLLFPCEEDSLSLYYWTGSEWQDAADTCTPASTYVRNATEDWLSVGICHLSQFSIGGR